jgi:hypothetical protein
MTWGILENEIATSASNPSTKMPYTLLHSISIPPNTLQIFGGFYSQRWDEAFFCKSILGMHSIQGTHGSSAICYLKFCKYGVRLLLFCHFHSSKLLFKICSPWNEVFLLSTTCKIWHYKAYLKQCILPGNQIIQSKSSF